MRERERDLRIKGQWDGSISVGSARKSVEDCIYYCALAIHIGILLHRNI